MPNSEDLISEIKQIMEQYRREVPGKRSPFPSSAKERVWKLIDLGINCAEISRRTEAPYFSVLRWKKEKVSGNFRPVRLTENATGPKGLISGIDTVTVSVRGPGNQKKSCTDTVTVSVITPSGVRIEGVNVNLLFQMFPEFGNRK